MYTYRQLHACLFILTNMFKITIPSLTSHCYLSESLRMEQLLTVEVLPMLSSLIFVKLELMIRNAKLPQQLVSVSQLIDMLVRVSVSLYYPGPVQNILSPLVNT